MRFSFRDAVGNQYTLMSRDEESLSETHQALTPAEVDKLIADLGQTAHGRALLDVMNERARANTPLPPPSLAQELGITEPALAHPLPQPDADTEHHS